MGHTDEAPEMTVKFEGSRINIWHVAAILMNTALAGIVWNDTKRDIGDSKEDIASLQASITDIQKQLPMITQLQGKVDRTVEQVAENKSGIAETNKRIDRVVESFGGKLDSVTEGIAKLNTAVQVLSSKLDDIQDRPDKSIFKLRTIKP